MNHGKQCERVIVFDVNETLLDIEILNPFFERTFGDARVMRQWFAELILYSQALTLSGSYTDFGKLAIAVLSMVTEIRGVTLQASDVDDFKDHMRRLPAHRDAAPALEMLRIEGFRMVTLTNSAPDAGKAVLDKAGLAHSRFVTPISFGRRSATYSVGSATTAEELSGPISARFARTPPKMAYWPCIPVPNRLDH
jgi:2-haloalkanoic acid dehalogenase type II